MLPLGNEGVLCGHHANEATKKWRGINAKDVVQRLLVRDIAVAQDCGILAILSSGCFSRNLWPCLEMRLLVFQSWLEARLASGSACDIGAIVDGPVCGE